MAVFNRMLNTQALLFFYILAGIGVSKAGIITPAVRENFNLFLIRLTLPMMILSSFLGDVALEQLRGAGLIMIISATGCTFAWLIGRALWSKREWAQRGPLVFGVTFSNAANAGMPVSQLVFGDVGVFLASIYLLPMRILIWTLGLSFFVRDKSKSMLKELLLNPCIIVSPE